VLLDERKSNVLSDKALRPIVGVDGSPASDAAVNWAAHDAVMRGAALTSMHVQDPIALTWSQAKALEEVVGGRKPRAVAFSQTRRGRKSRPECLDPHVLGVGQQRGRSIRPCAGDGSPREHGDTGLIQGVVRTRISAARAAVIVTRDCSVLRSRARSSVSGRTGESPGTAGNWRTRVRTVR
jgi:hypothetical protein